jgi:hypothetical protein
MTTVLGCPAKCVAGDAVGVGSRHRTVDEHVAEAGLTDDLEGWRFNAPAWLPTEGCP